MGRSIVSRMRQFASRWFQPKSKPHLATFKRSLRIESLEVRRLLTALPSLLVSDITGNVQAYAGAEGSGGYPSAGPFQRTVAGGSIGYAFGPNGNLYVLTGSGEVDEYHGSTGAPMGAFIAASTSYGSPTGGITFGPDGNLYLSYVNGPAPMIVKYNGTTATASIFVSGGNLYDPMGLAFGPDANLYVVDGSNKVFCFKGPTSTTNPQFSSISPCGSGQQLAGGIVFGGSWGWSYGNFYIDGYEGANGFVEVYNMNGHYESKPISGNTGGASGHALGEPAGMAFSGGGGSLDAGNAYAFLYIVDVSKPSDAGQSCVTCYEDFPSSGGAVDADYVSTVVPTSAGLSWATSIAFGPVVTNLPVATGMGLTSTGSVYGATATATATLNYNGAPLAAEPISFVNVDTGVSLGTVDTNASGQATISFSNVTSWGNTGTSVRATFAGDNYYESSETWMNVPSTPAPLTITANNQSMVYGSSLPALTVSYSGFAPGESAASLMALPTVSTTATSASPVSGDPYTITAGGAMDSNYSITYVSGTLTVTAAPLTITAVNKTKVYGAALPTLTASYAGFVNGDTSASLTILPTLSTTATAASHVAGSPYTITASGAVDPNYAISYVPGSLTVTTAPLTVTAVDKTKVYGAALPALTASYAGFVNGDTSANLATQPTIATTATAASHVAGSPYPITASGAADTDYSISYGSGNLTVTTAPLTITAVNKTKVYGAALPALTASYAGFVNGDTSASLSTQPTLVTTATAASHVAGNPYSISASGATDSDYSISYVNGNLTVTPVPLAITAVNQTKVYGAALPTLTASYAGFVNGDTAASLTKQPSLVTTATAASHVAGSPYAISASGAVDADYSINYVSGRLYVTPAPLTIMADDKFMLMGHAVPTLTATYEGLVNGDTPASLTHLPTLSTTATPQSYYGSYPINISGAAATDYSITQVPATMTVISTVGQAVLLPDPLNPSKMMLNISGTTGNDVIMVNPAATAGYVTVTINGRSLGSFNPATRIVAHGWGGSDTIVIAAGVTLPVWLYADTGNVQFVGGGGPTLFVGGPGTNTFWGGSGPTVMIAGSGTATMMAGGGNAVLIGGTTAYNTTPRALAQILTAWSSPANYATRVSELTSDPYYPLNASTVFGNNAADALFGNAAGMTLFYQAPGDNLHNVTSAETVIVTNLIMRTWPRAT